MADANDALGSARFFVRSGTGFLREAWLAAQFGLKAGALQIRLVGQSEQWPDFEAIINHETLRVECVEALEHGRKRSEEYRIYAEREVQTGQLVIEDDPYEDWLARSKMVVPAIQNLIRIKLEKQYGDQNSHLMIYVNIHCWGVEKEKVEKNLRCNIIPAFTSFKVVWVLWEDRLYNFGPVDDD